MKKTTKSNVLLGAVLGGLVLLSSVGRGQGKWPHVFFIPSNGKKFESTFNGAEIKYGLPAGMLWRVAMQESRFRPEIIDGRVKGADGEEGIMQILPKWHPTASPLDPVKAIYYAAEYLRKNYDRFGTWEKALTAYNWGPTNLSKKGLKASPASTKKYVKNVLLGVNVNKIRASQ